MEYDKELFLESLEKFKSSLEYFIYDGDYKQNLKKLDKLIHLVEKDKLDKIFKEGYDDDV